ncbi:MAG: hypothetical protein C5B59_18115 [Bacteroidetes bacterium]|nr:MAG: hypothetical protein C5B59_18115 [Bacteroidota bacterium]
MKYFVSCVLVLLFTQLLLADTVYAQTLFTYGAQPVSKQEFLKAYKKNNTKSKASAKSYQEYLDLYTRYKLKVRAAYDMKLDTLANQLADLQNFRSQIVDQYMNNEASLNKLINEAFLRSQKDVHVQHIFIGFPKNPSPSDTLQAFQKAMNAYGDLAKGNEFGNVAKEYSEDPFEKSNSGDIGFITVFDIPYPLESLAYTTAVGKFTKPFRGKTGYHILKVIGARKAIGKVKVAQILLVFPYHATDAAKLETRQRADSIYQVLQKGGDFAELARHFSGDNLTYQSGGEMPEFGVGKYDPAFESAAFNLKTPGEVSRPVESEFGYHIIKLIGRKPTPSQKDKMTTDAIRMMVLNDARIETAKKEMLQTILRDIQYKQAAFNESQLWIYTDSILQNKTKPSFPDLTENTVVFSFGKKQFLVKDWLAHRKAMKTSGASGGKSNKEWFDQYVQITALEYYRNHLENYNKEFAYQLKEFQDGNLLFEIMQRKVWDKASSDSNGLKDYFQAHKSSYVWQPSADAIVFTCAGNKMAEDIKSKIGQNPSYWRRITDSASGLIQADSGRFELSQLPLGETNKLQNAQFSSQVKAQGDNNVTMAYIIRTYDQKMPRNFSDARGLVINDYQNYLEDKWIEELKKKYPVKVNEVVMKSLPLN